MDIVCEYLHDTLTTRTHARTPIHLHTYRHRAAHIHIHTAAHCRRLLCSKYTTALYIYYIAVFTTQLLTAGFSNILVFKAVTWKELDFNELVAQGLIDITRVPIETNSRMFKSKQGPPALNRRQN